MKKQRKRQKRAPALLAILCAVAMMTSLLSSVQAQTVENGAVGSDATDFDIFMNVDPSYGISGGALADKVGGYLDQLIGTDGKQYRIETSSATIDPTDLTKWHAAAAYYLCSFGQFDNG